MANWRMRVALRPGMLRSANWALLLVISGFGAEARDLSARTVTELLFKTAPGARVDLQDGDLNSMDLSGLDFKQARLAHADLFGTDLTGSSLKSADLAGARLDRAVITRTDFSGAHLAGVSLMRPTLFTDLSLNRAEAPRFECADLSSARLTGNFDGTNFRSANLALVNFSPHEPRADISFFPRNFCRGCDFSAARLTGADFNDASLSFARFVDAELSSANLSRTDLTKADLTGADLSGADLTKANLDGAILTGVRGLDSVTGLGLALNLDRALQ